MAVREAARRRWRGTCSSRSRTTCDFEILRPRDSASMSATSSSGNRTVRLFMKELYYTSGRCARQAKVRAKPGHKSERIGILTSADKDTFLVCSSQSGWECQNDAVRVLIQPEIHTIGLSGGSPLVFDCMTSEWHQKPSRRKRLLGTLKGKTGGPCRSSSDEHRKE
jgi:hypothetical protein